MSGCSSGGSRLDEAAGAKPSVLRRFAAESTDPFRPLVGRSPLVAFGPTCDAAAHSSSRQRRTARRTPEAARDFTLRYQRPHTRHATQRDGEYAGAFAPASTDGVAI